LTASPDTFQPPVRSAGERLPVTLVTGFLGSGKTTLVNHILSNRQGVRAAVLVNELGEIGIDNELIIAAEDGMIELSNGCICCSVNNDLVDSIVRVLGRPGRIDHLIVETTGVADPLPVALTFLRSEFRKALRLDAIVAVADADQFSLELFDGIAARNQLRYADAVLINKCDCVGAERLAQVEGQIRSMNPEARIAHTVRGAVALPLILDVDLFRAGQAMAPAPGQGLGQGFAESPGQGPGRTHDHAHPRAAARQSAEPGRRHAHLAADGFVSLSFESERPFSVVRFQAFLDAGRPPGLFRGKGFLWLAETGRRYIFHLVGGRFSLDEDDRADRGSNRLVLIGRDLDLGDLRARLADCLVDAPTDMAAPG